MTTTVTAVVGGDPQTQARCVARLRAFGVAVAADLESASDGWIWLLGSGGTPSASTLPALLAATGNARVVAGVAVDSTSTIVPWRAPSGRHADARSVIESVTHHQLPLSRATTDCLLADRAALIAARTDEIDHFGPFAGIVTVSRLLQTLPGVIVPAACVAVEPSFGLPRLRDLPAGLRAVRCGALTTRDLVSIYEASRG